MPALYWIATRRDSLQPLDTVAHTCVYVGTQAGDQRAGHAAVCTTGQHGAGRRDCYTAHLVPGLVCSVLGLLVGLLTSAHYSILCTLGCPSNCVVCLVRCILSSCSHVARSILDVLTCCLDCTTSARFEASHCERAVFAALIAQLGNEQGNSDSVAVTGTMIKNQQQLLPPKLFNVLQEKGRLEDNRQRVGGFDH